MESSGGLDMGEIHAGMQRLNGVNAAKEDGTQPRMAVRVPRNHNLSGDSANIGS
ncbi:hypothetical protein Tco_1250598, partial [Tanacetum coccineum]